MRTLLDHCWTFLCKLGDFSNSMNQNIVTSVSIGGGGGGGESLFGLCLFLKKNTSTSSDCLIFDDSEVTYLASGQNKLFEICNLIFPHHFLTVSPLVIHAS